MLEHLSRMYTKDPASISKQDMVSVPRPETSSINDTRILYPSGICEKEVKYMCRFGSISKMTPHECAHIQNPEFQVSSIFEERILSL